MSAFPGCTEEDMRALHAWLAERGWKPEQVQCFIPLPGTAAAAMFHAGCDMQGKPIYVAKTDAERLRQHAILMPDTGRAPGGKPGHGKGRHGKGQERPDSGRGRRPRKRHGGSA
jgi:radical SAM superfamily enzyme YgiQ (UPF0313 family)